MSLSFNSIPHFDGYNYGYWKLRMRFFLKSVHVWHIVESGWTPPKVAIAEWTIPKKQTHVENDKAMNAIC
jgi:hypothetical protein